MKLVQRDIASLVPYARNARTHSDEQVDQIARSIAEFGFTNPVLIDGEGGIIAGHGRVLAAKALGMAKVPTIALDYLTEAQRRAYVIADNRIALNAGWDVDLLVAEVDAVLADIRLGELPESIEDIFNLDDLALDFGAPVVEGLTDPDDVPEVGEGESITKPGDLWLLGDHRLLCGDSTNAEDVARLMNGERAELCFTSPPYLQQRSYEGNVSQDWDGLMTGIADRFRDATADNAQIFVNLGLLHEKGRVLRYWDGFLDTMESSGWPLFAWYVWDKGQGVPGEYGGRFTPAHEWIFHFAQQGGGLAKTVPTKGGTGGGPRRVVGTDDLDNRQRRVIQNFKIHNSVIDVTAHVESTGHPAAFPVGLPLTFIESWPDASDVYDPFLGSGTTMIAAEQLGRRCYGMEISPHYCDVIVKRFEAFTGKTAVRAS